LIHFYKRVSQEEDIFDHGTDYHDVDILTGRICNGWGDD